MTIVKAASAPLFVVLGSSGNQGGSVVRALAASSRPYRVRAIMRDTSKPIAKELEASGVETRAADVLTSEGLKHAFQDADLAFGHTASEYGAMNAADVEFAKAKSQIDAVKAAGAKVLVWPGESDLAPQTGFDVDFFTGKARATQYARSVGLKVHDVQAPAFATNYITHSGPRKQDDGTFVLAAPYSPDTPIPLGDIEADFGRYAVAALEHDLDTVYATPEYIPASQIAQELAKASGKEVKYQQVPFEVLQSILEKRMGPAGAKHMVDMHRTFEVIGYFGGNKTVDLTESNKYLTPPARTFAQFLASRKAQVDQLFA